MPRKSAAALAIVTPLRQDRPEPPDSLCGFAADEWRRVVAARPADWFGRENLAHLKSYCEHLAAAELIGREIAALPRPINVSMRSKLLRDRRDERKIAMDLAHSLRLTVHSQRTAQTAGTESRRSNLPKPWDHVPLHLRTFAPAHRPKSCGRHEMDAKILAVLTRIAETLE
jgi:hypothetical protein